MTRTLTEAGAGTPPAQRLSSLDVTVLAGGPSVEREVSLESGKMVRDALKRLDHHAIMLDIREDDLTALSVPADVVFIALHGTFGEDGTLQRTLEERNIAYTGSDAGASALAMDKVNTKTRLIEREIPTPLFDLVKAGRVAQCAEERELPAVVKPRASGSSVDTFIARDRSALAAALETVVSRYGSALVERYIDGPELTVGILDGAALPVCQIRTKREFYDYDAKYVDDDTEYLFDIDLPGELLARVQELSVRANDAIGCRDFARVDWMIDGETLDPYLIEINTIPGFTSHSLLPKSAAQVGVSFDDLCQRVVELGMKRASD